MAGTDAIAWQQDRKACLQCMAAFFRDPSQFGCSSDTQLILPAGFNLQTAEFAPDALKRLDPSKVKEIQSQTSGPFSAYKPQQTTAFSTAQHSPVVTTSPFGRQPSPFGTAMPLQR